MYDFDEKLMNYFFGRVIHNRLQFVCYVFQTLREGPWKPFGRGTRNHCRGRDALGHYSCQNLDAIQRASDGAKEKRGHQRQIQSLLKAVS